MKHTKYVYAAVIALFIQSVANARVEAEISGYESYGASNGSWEQPADVVIAPVAVQAPPALPLKQNAQLAYNGSGELVGAETQMVAALPPNQKSFMRIVPMVGAGDYVGRWNTNTKNNYHFGLATEFLTDSSVSFEVEGSYSNYSLAYTSLAEPSVGFVGPRLMAHKFDQFSIGGNAKVYLMNGMFRPFIGGGLHGVYYAGMQQRMPGDYIRNYDEIVGSGQVLAGADVAVSRSTSVGVRGSWMIPILHKPLVRDMGAFAAPGFEEASLINASYYKIMGTVSVDL